MGRLLVIYSYKESLSAGSAQFWSNETGWGSLAGATIFLKEDTKGLNLPAPNDSYFVGLVEAGRIVAEWPSEEGA